MRIYLGAEPLDPAFADRYPWIVEIPSTVSHQEQQRIIRGTEYHPEEAQKAFSKRYKIQREIWNGSNIILEISLYRTS